jgi:WD40 repeat protein
MHTRRFEARLLRKGDGNALSLVLVAAASVLWLTAGPNWAFSQEGKALATLTGHGGEVTFLAFSKDGRTLASALWGEVKIWDLATRLELLAYKYQERESRDEKIAVSPDGKLKASSGTQGVVVERLEPGGKKEPERILEQVGVNSVAFSPDGKSLASGGAFGEVRIWHVATGEMLVRWSAGALSMKSSIPATARLWQPDAEIR